MPDSQWRNRQVQRGRRECDLGSLGEATMKVLLILNDLASRSNVGALLDRRDRIQELIPDPRSSRIIL